MRGGGGNFGVATSFEYQLHPVGPVLAGIVAYPVAKATEVLRCFSEVTSAAPDELASGIIIVTFPDGTPVVAMVVCYNGPSRERGACPETAQNNRLAADGSGQLDALHVGAEADRRLLSSGTPELLEVELPEESQRRGYRHDGGALRRAARRRRAMGLSNINWAAR